MLGFWVSFLLFRCDWHDAMLLGAAFFPLFAYEKIYTSLAPRKIRTAFVYTMTSTHDKYEKLPYDEHLRSEQQLCTLVFGFVPRVLCVYATYQFPDYSKYMTLYFSETAKTRAREKQFPIDCHKAEALDTTLVNEACGG